jgi:hypothetical protein
VPLHRLSLHLSADAVSRFPVENTSIGGVLFRYVAMICATQRDGSHFVAVIRRGTSLWLLSDDKQPQLVKAIDAINLLRSTQFIVLQKVPEDAQPEPSAPAAPAAAAKAPAQPAKPPTVAPNKKPLTHPQQATPAKSTNAPAKDQHKSSQQAAQSPPSARPQPSAHHDPTQPSASAGKSAPAPEASETRAPSAAATSEKAHKAPSTAQQDPVADPPVSARTRSANTGNNEEEDPEISPVKRDRSGISFIADTSALFDNAENPKRKVFQQPRAEEPPIRKRRGRGENKHGTAILRCGEVESNPGPSLSKQTATPLKIVL